MSEYIVNLRHAYGGGPHLVPVNIQAIIQDMEGLKAEVCRLSRVAISKRHIEDEKRRMKEAGGSWRARVVNIGCSVFGVGVTAVNTGAGILGFMTAEMAAYSVGAGATLLAFRK